MYNNNDEHNNENIAHYRASGNLNTAIGNPSVNINDTMNVNIQNMVTNNSDFQPKPPEEQSQILNNNMVTNQNINVDKQSNMIKNQNNINNNQYTNKANISASDVTRTYVTTDNRPKKKKLTLNLGSEFKIALLIIVILLVFIFILPLITDLFKGH